MIKDLVCRIKSKDYGEVGIANDEVFGLTIIECLNSLEHSDRIFIDLCAAFGCFFDVETSDVASELTEAPVADVLFRMLLASAFSDTNFSVGMRPNEFVDAVFFRISAIRIGATDFMNAVFFPDHHAKVSGDELCLGDFVFHLEVKCAVL